MVPNCERCETARLSVLRRKGVRARNIYLRVMPWACAVLALATAGGMLLYLAHKDALVLWSLAALPGMIVYMLSFGLGICIEKALQPHQGWIVFAEGSLECHVHRGPVFDRQDREAIYEPVSVAYAGGVMPIAPLWIEITLAEGAWNPVLRSSIQLEPHLKGWSVAQNRDSRLENLYVTDPFGERQLLKTTNKAEVERLTRLISANTSFQQDLRSRINRLEHHQDQMRSVYRGLEAYAEYLRQSKNHGRGPVMGEARKVFLHLCETIGITHDPLSLREEGVALLEQWARDLNLKYAGQAVEAQTVDFGDTR